MEGCGGRARKLELGFTGSAAGAFAWLATAKAAALARNFRREQRKSRSVMETLSQIVANRRDTFNLTPKCASGNGFKAKSLRRARAGCSPAAGAPMADLPFRFFAVCCANMLRLRV